MRLRARPDAAEQRLERLLRDETIEGEGHSEERAWSIAAEAFAEREPNPRRSRFARAILVALGIAGTAAFALSPAGAAVSDLVRDAIETDPTPQAGALSEVPAPGALLVESGPRLWLVDDQGSKSLLGDYGDATWSPRGLFVGATTGDGLSALAPDGEAQWNFDPPGGEVSSPRWSPSGFRIAYLAAGALRVVAGDGTGDRLLAEGVGQIPPSWRPPAAGDLAASTTGYGTHQLTWVAPEGRVVTVDTDSGAVIWVARPAGTDAKRSEAIESVEWSADGHRLLVRAERGYWILDRSGKLVVGVPREPSDTVAISPDGTRLALVQRNPRNSIVYLRGTRPRNQPNATRRVFIPGAIDDVVWSPDGEWLLISWRTGNQWVFVQVNGKRTTAIDSIDERFEAGPGDHPTVTGWCCQAAAVKAGEGG